MKAKAAGAFTKKALAFAAALSMTPPLSGSAFSQQWNLESAGPMQIPSLEELSRPRNPRTYIPPPNNEEAGPLGPFLNDSTLRSGDIVVTPDGPMKFRGTESLSHRSQDFSPLEGSAKPNISHAPR